MSDGFDVVIGKILSPHGTGGMVKVYPYSDFPDRVHLLEEVEVEQQSRRLLHRVEKASVHGRFWLIKFQKIDTRDEAEELRGSLIRIPQAERMPLPEGTFYHDQLKDLQVFDTGGRLLGTVVEIISGGGHDQILIARAGNEDQTSLIPVVENFIRQVDLVKGVIVVELPEGMLDL